ncbi:MAG: hypothetical protein QOG65_430, partial [Actinomycetota bacterium]|nr:hypothetical protein [Actinomycetota bacterium]
MHIGMRITPPVTKRLLSTTVIAIPSLSTVKGGTHVPGGRPDDPPVAAGRSITLRMGACPIPDPDHAHHT